MNLHQFRPIFYAFTNSPTSHLTEVIFGQIFFLAQHNPCTVQKHKKTLYYIFVKVDFVKSLLYLVDIPSQNQLNYQMDKPLDFLVADTQLYKRLCPSVGLSVHWSVGPSVNQHKLKSGKTCIFTPAHPSATGGCVSGLVSLFFIHG